MRRCDTLSSAPPRVANAADEPPQQIHGGAGSMLRAAAPPEYPVAPNRRSNSCPALKALLAGLPRSNVAYLGVVMLVSILVGCGRDMTPIPHCSKKGSALFPADTVTEKYPPLTSELCSYMAPIPYNSKKICSSADSESIDWLPSQRLTSVAKIAAANSGVNGGLYDMRVDTYVPRTKSLQPPVHAQSPASITLPLC